MKKHIVISVGRAFGYDHPATTLIIDVLSKYPQYVKNKLVLDVGAGSGLLSIVIHRLGANKVYGIDICPFVIAEAIKNVRKNGIKKDKVKILLKDISKIKRRFQFIVANVPINVHELVSKKILNILDTKGALLIGGITENQLSMVKSLYNPLQPYLFFEKEGWHSILFKKLK